MIGGARNNADKGIVQVIDSVLGDARGDQTDDAIPFDSQLWSTLRGLGFSELTRPVAEGGSGGTWREAAALVSGAARHGVRLPYVEHDLLGGWLLEQVGLYTHAGLRTVTTVRSSGGAVHVPWGLQADRVTLLVNHESSWWVEDLEASELEMVPGGGIHGSHRARVIQPVTLTHGVPVTSELFEAWRLRLMLARSLQMSGAMSSAIAGAVEHARTRVQFGRSVSNFQLVKSLIVTMAAELALAQAAVDRAVDLLVDNDDVLSREARLAVSIAASCGFHACDEVVKNSHQVHGAIGTTAEHSLHRFTLPLLAWRTDLGPAREVDERIARAVTSSGSRLWAVLTGL